MAGERDELLDHALLQEMAKLMEKLVTSGNAELDANDMKNFKRICRRSDGYIKHAYHLLMTQLEQEHCEIRLSTFLMIDELFNRSHAFRELLVSNLQTFMDLTLEIDSDQPLPPPLPVAKILKTKVIAAIQQWQTKYGEAYKKLAIGYQFLKNCKKIDFVSLQSRQIQEEYETARRQKLLQDRLESVLKEIRDIKPEIKRCLMEISSCFQLLVPDPEMFLTNVNLLSPIEDVNVLPPFAVNTDTVCSRQQKKSKHGDPQRVSDLNMSRDKSELPDNGVNNSNDTEDTASIRHTSQNNSLASLVGDDNTLNRIEPASSLTNTPDVVSSSNSNEMEDVSDRCNTNIVSDVISNYVQQGLEAPEALCENNSADSNNGEDEDNDDFEDVDEDLSDAEDEDHCGDGVDDTTVDEPGQNSRLIRQHGLGSRVNYTLRIEVPTGPVKIQRDTNNADILDTTSDLIKLILTMFLPKVSKWLSVMSKCGATQTEVRKVIDLKQCLEDARQKYNDLIAEEKVERSKNDDDEDSVEQGLRIFHHSEQRNKVVKGTYDDFEEVPEKEGYEPHVPAHLRKEYGLEDLPSVSVNHKAGASTAAKGNTWTFSGSMMDRHGKAFDNMATDPTTLSATLKKLHERISLSKSKSFPTTSEMSRGHTSQTATSSSASSKSVKDTVMDEMLKRAPYLPPGFDTDNWENPNPEAPLVERYDSLHKFWTPSEHSDFPSQSDLANLKSRQIAYPVKFEPVKWRCRAQLANGRLCERMDRKKCPFHGVIIARDNMGRPSDPDEAKKFEAQQQQAENSSAWDDPELQRDIEAATGIDLTRGTKGKGRGKGKAKLKKYPNLTDLKAKQNTSRNRLESKVFNRAAMKRVASHLDDITFKRHKDKFANQFNYALRPT